MREKIKKTSIIFVIIILLILPYFVFAETTKGALQGAGESAGYITENKMSTSFAAFLGLIVKAFLSLLGIIFIGEILYAGYNWMTARGEEEKVTKAKDTIRRSIIGLIIIVGAYAIAQFIELYIL